MANQHTYETNAGRGKHGRRVCVSLTQLEYDRLCAWCRKYGTQSAVIRWALEESGVTADPREDE